MKVTKMGGAVIADDNTAQAIAKAWHDDPRPWVIVHGGGPQLNEALLAIDGEPVKIEGLRVTSGQAAMAAAETMDGLGLALAHALEELGVPATHVATDAGCFQAVPKDIPGIGRVGTVTDVVKAPIVEATRGNGVAIVTPVGHDAVGPLNVNADEGASMVAIALGADELLLATDVPAVLDGKGQPIDAISGPEMEQLIRSGVVHGGMVPKLRNAIDATRSGVVVTIGPLDLSAPTGTRVLPSIEVPA